MDEKINDVEIKIRCAFCGKEIVNPRIWENCSCEATIMTTYKSTARKKTKKNKNNQEEKK